MKHLLSLFALLAFTACSNKEKYENQPVAPWTYPASEYRVIRTQAGRTATGRVTRLVGWDEGFYYFDWSHATAAINRGTGRVDREQFDLENNGALTLEKGQVTTLNGQVRTLTFQ